MLISQVPLSEEISIAPDKGKKPISILQDRYCEELVFPHIFSNDQFGYRAEREVEFVGNKAKGRISNHAVRNVCFSKKFRVFYFLETHALRSALLPYYQRIKSTKVF